MKRFLITSGALVLLPVVYLALFPFGQRVDRSFEPTVEEPANVQRHPTILFDEGHFNSHTARGGYEPFARLMENDGYQIRRNRDTFTAETLRGVDVLVIVNAAGGSNPKLFGINLVPLRKGQRDASAFGDAEIETVRTWVAEGGSLLLIADHHPFGWAASRLAAAFGVRMHGGFAEVPQQYPNQTDPGAIQYTRENGLLADHPISNGRSIKERVLRVMSFTGQSLDAMKGDAILRLPTAAIEYVPPPPRFQKQPAGTAQGVALDWGKGRVVVLGEAGMLTAQVDENEHRFGMNVKGFDNRQFALNVLHWLSRKT